MNDKERKPWVTASDVAARAGVSRSAVSRAFSPTASIAPQTRERVMVAARALGYQVNLIARDMITQRSSMIGVVTAGFENPFRARLLSDLMAALGQRALTPLVTNAEDPRQVRQSLEQLLSYRIAGLVMTSASPPLSVAQQYLEHRIPVVMINREANLPGADIVVSDNAAGAPPAAPRRLRAGSRSSGRSARATARSRVLPRSSMRSGAAMHSTRHSHTCSTRRPTPMQAASKPRGNCSRTASGPTACSARRTCSRSA